MRTHAWISIAHSLVMIMCAILLYICRGFQGVPALWALMMASGIVFASIHETQDED